MVGHLGGHRGSVCVGDCLDDREAKAEPFAGAGARSVDALKRLEQTAEAVGWDRRPGVGDAEDRVVVRHTSAHVDVAGGLVVVDGVREKVCCEAFDEAWVAIGEGRGEQLLDSQPAGIDAFERVRRDRGEVKRFAVVEAALAAREHEQGFDQVFLVLAGCE